MSRPSAVAEPMAKGLSDFVRENHAHFEIERETIDGPSGRTVSGFDVRLFAMHGKVAHFVPHCPVCARVASALRDVASTALLADAVGGDVQIAPFEPVLYQSRQAPTSDEVTLTIHLSPPESFRANPESWLRAVRGHLSSLGVLEQ